MTRFAVLSDIHGNLPALEAVITDLQQLAPDRVIVNGDIVNRGPQSKECLQAIRAIGWPVMFGNHEEYVLKYADNHVSQEWYDDLYLPFLRVVRDLSVEEITYLRTLPRSCVVDAPGLPSVLVVHGSPRALNDGLGPWATDAQLLEAIQAVPEPVVIGAHTHRPMDRRIGKRWVLNCGAIGAPFNGDPRAQYLVMTAHSGAWEAEFRRVPYDRARTYAAWEQTGYMQYSTIGQVFKYEVETATYHYFAYLDFCKVNGLEAKAMASFAAYRRATQEIIPGRALKHWMED